MHRTASRQVLLLITLAGCRSAIGVASHERVDPTRAPEQSPVGADSREFELSTGSSAFSLTPAASYRVAARVLGTERYFVGWQSTLSPLDLALGWGRMADDGVDRFIEWRQSGRWYFYHWSAASAYRNADIVAESANVHVVPASQNLRRALLDVQVGDVVLLSGQLINARRVESARDEWRSSLSRTDFGGGSCELMLVERLVVRGLEYR